MGSSVEMDLFLAEGQQSRIGVVEYRSRDAQRVTGVKPPQFVVDLRLGRAEGENRRAESGFVRGVIAWLRESTFPTCQYRFTVLDTTLHCKCNRPGITVTIFHKPKSLFLCFHLNLHTPNRVLKRDAVKRRDFFIRQWRRALALR